MTKRKIALMSMSLALLLLLLGGALFGQATAKNSVYRYLSLFSEVFDLVRSNYVEPVATEQLLDGAFGGVTDAVDEFSYYVPASQMAAYRNFTDVDDNGLGLVVTKRFGYAFVVAAIPGSPAEKAGIERGDFIEKIDGAPTAKMAVWQVRNALRSARLVKLQILRGGQTKRDEIAVEPAKFHPLALTTKQYGSVAYVRIPYFEKDTAEQFAAALEEIRGKGTRKLIVDLRGNAGGDVEEAIAAADHLLISGTITGLDGRKIDDRKWQADRATAFDGDLHVLIDNSTAAGAEVFAGAIRGNERGKLVGVTTYGKSIVQRFITLPSGGGVQMTIARYTTPDLKPIKEAGIKPDVTVDMTVQAIRVPEGEKPAPREDLILNKALGLFGEKAAA